MCIPVHLFPAASSHLGGIFTPAFLVPCWVSTPPVFCTVFPPVRLNLPNRPGKDERHKDSVAENIRKVEGETRQQGTTVHAERPPLVLAKHHAHVHRRSVSTAARRIRHGPRYPLASTSVSTVPPTIGISVSIFPLLDRQTWTVRLRLPLPRPSRITPDVDVSQYGNGVNYEL